MEKFIPYKKLSKKEKRKADQARRQTWGQLNPVTRKPENSRAYNRKRTQDWKRKLPDPASFVLLQVFLTSELYFLFSLCYTKTIQKHQRSAAIWSSV